MAEKVITILKRLPVIIGSIMMIAGVVLIFALPIMLIPVLTETSEQVNDDFEPGAMKFATYATYGDFTISGVLTEENRTIGGIYRYRIDDSEFDLTASEDIGDVDDEVLLKVRVAQDKLTDEDYLVVIEKKSSLPYNIPGFVILIIGALLFIIGIVRKTAEERESKEKAIARKKALDKELDMLERELQTSMGPAHPGMQPGYMPPGQMPQQQPGMAPQQPGMPPAGMAQQAQPQRPMQPQQPGMPPAGMAQAQPQRPMQPQQPGMPQQQVPPKKPQV